MIIGVRGLTWAKFASGGEGSACVYTGGESLTDMMVRVGYTTERDESGFYADDHKIDGENSVRSVSIELELAKLPLEARASMLGWQKASNDYQETDQAAPYIGIGFIYAEKYKGTVVYTPHWIYKCQMGINDDGANTKGENVEFQTRTISGSGMAVSLDNSGVNVFRTIGAASGLDGFATYAAALAWLKNMAGIAST